MTKERLETLLTIGETVAVEFKRCGGNIEKDTYQSVCSFLNRFGGDIFLGVLDDGTVEGVPQKSISSLMNEPRCKHRGIVLSFKGIAVAVCLVCCAL